MDALSSSNSLVRLDLSGLSPCPNDGHGPPKQLAALRAALPKIDIVSELRATGRELLRLVPHGWPRSECNLGFGKTILGGKLVD